MNNRSTWGSSGEGCEGVEKGGHGLFQSAPQHHGAWPRLLFLVFFNSTQCSQTSMVVGLSFTLFQTLTYMPITVEAEPLEMATSVPLSLWAASFMFLTTRSLPPCDLHFHCCLQRVLPLPRSRPPHLVCFMSFVAYGHRTGLICELGGCS